MKSIFTKNLKKCYITGNDKNIHIHHIFGAANKTNCEEYGFIIPLTDVYHNMSDNSIHFNKNWDLEIKLKCQDYWINELHKTEEDFIKIFGKWWTPENDLLYSKKKQKIGFNTKIRR